MKGKGIETAALLPANASPASARPRKSVSFEDLPSTIGHSTLVAQAENEEVESGGRGPRKNAPRTLEPEWDKTKPPAETPPEWPFPSPSTVAQSQRVNDEVIPAALSMPQDLAGTQELIQTLADQLFDQRDRLEKHGDLRSELVEQSRQRARLQYDENSWKEDKELLLKELEQLRNQSHQPNSDTFLRVEELKDQLKQRDNRMKQLLGEHGLRGRHVNELEEKLQHQQDRMKELLEEQEYQGKHFNALTEELDQEKRKYSDLVAEGRSVGGDREEAARELQEQQEVIKRLTEEVNEAKGEGRYTAARCAAAQTVDIEAVPA